MRRAVLAACAVLLIPPVVRPASGHPARTATPALPTTWVIDPNHSAITFRIRHLISHVTGTFRQWSGTVIGDPPDWSSGSVEVTVQAASIDTRNDTRDDDLRSSDFFEVTKYPTITFKSTQVQARGDTFAITGDLTMHGVTRPVTLAAEYLGVSGQGASRRMGFHAETTINRTEFGVTWNRAVEGGGVLLGDDVEISIDLEAKPAGAPPPAGT